LRPTGCRKRSRAGSILRSAEGGLERALRDPGTRSLSGLSYRSLLLVSRNAGAEAGRSSGTAGWSRLSACQSSGESLDHECLRQEQHSFQGLFWWRGAGQFGNLAVYDRPIDFIREVPRSQVVIHHGGLGTAMWAMVNGVPQWGSGADLEKSIILDAARQVHDY